MKQYAFLIFFSVILAVHILVNGYIYYRGVHALEAVPAAQWWFKLAMILLVCSYPVGRFLERVWISPVSDAFHWIGAFWFAGMLYTVLALVVVDILRVGNFFFHYFPDADSLSYITIKLKAFYAVAGVVFVIVLAGFINAWSPKITELNLHIKKNSPRKTLRLVAASDIHMGSIIAQRKTAKLVRTINSLNPDIVLFAGDVVDEDVQPVIRQNLGRSLMQIKAPLGVFAITGNHEYIGGVDRTVKYLSTHGLTLLRDSVVLIDSTFYIAGREDRDKQRMTGVNRKSVDELLNSIDHTKPIILLDHQPYDLDVAQAAGVDVQISGHTHHGQLWPFGYITEKIFEVSRGYKQKSDSHFYVSTGFGTWGPPVRTGNRPEIIVMNLTFGE
jgi:predicted MPP superfamily phosphohydrolase